MGICHSKGPCFAKKITFGRDSVTETCLLLKETRFKCGKCPFQKFQIDVTGGKIYPYNPPINKEEK